jgi:hypothetical protein
VDFDGNADELAGTLGELGGEFGERDAATFTATTATA